MEDGASQGRRGAVSRRATLNARSRRRRKATERLYKIRAPELRVLSEIEVSGTFALWQGGLHDRAGSVTTADDAAAADG